MTKIPDSGGYLDPETGDWVSTTNSRGELNNSEEENSRHSSSRAAKNTQVGFCPEIKSRWRLTIFNLSRLMTCFQLYLFLLTVNVLLLNHDVSLYICYFFGEQFFLHIMTVHGGSRVC